MTADDVTAFWAGIQEHGNQYFAKYWVQERNEKVAAHSDAKPFDTREAAEEHIHERARSKGHRKIHWDNEPSVCKPGEVSDVPK